MERTLITNGLVLDPESGREHAGGLLMEGGVIREIFESAETPAESEFQIIDAKGHWITPGFIDLKTNLREPGEEWKETVETGAKAALAGGFTTICASPDTVPVNDEASVTNLIRERGESAGAARVLPLAAATTGQRGENLADLGDMKSAGAIGVSNGNHAIASARMMRRVMEYCKTFDLPLLLRSFEPTLSRGGLMNESLLSTIMGLASIPAEAETIAVARDIELAALTGARVHLGQLSTAGSVRLLRTARARGLAVTGDVTPHHLTLTERANETYDTNTKVFPPFRSEEDRSELIAGLSDGTLSAIATNHEPQNIADKELEFVYAQPGMIGLETAFSLLMKLVRDGHVQPAQAIRSLTLGPAEVLGLDEGRLRAGSRADVVILAPDEEWEVTRDSLRSRSYNTPFMGKKLMGRVTHTFVAGELLFTA